MEESFNAQEIARFIDHTLLKPEATPAQIAALCAEASQYQFASVCVNPTYVRLCTQQLASSAVKVCTVIGFPLGAHLTEVKVFEAQKALQDGALELDMVINIGALKAGNDQLVGEDIQQVVKTSHAAGGLVKVIIETALLSEEEKVRACRLAQEAGADFVKTSTGFSHGGATLEDVALMRRVVGPQMGVKAAGGVRSYQDAISMIRAGATRIGTSSGVAIVLGAPQPYR